MWSLVPKVTQARQGRDDLQHSLYGVAWSTPTGPVADSILRERERERKERERERERESEREREALIGVGDFQIALLASGIVL